MNKKYSTLFLCAAFALGAQAAEETAKADVLGRHISNMRNTPKAYVKDVKKQVSQNQKDAGLKEKKVLARKSNYTYPSGEVNIATTQATFTAIANNWGQVTKTYTLNGSTVTENQYSSTIDYIENLDAARKQYTNQYVYYNNNQNYGLYDVRRAGDDGYGQSYYQANNHGETIKFWNYTTLKSSLSNMTNYTDGVGYTGSGIGISLTAEGLPLMKYSHAPADRFTLMHNPVNSDAQRTVRGSENARVLNNIASGAHVYGLQNRCGYQTGGKAFASDGYAKNPKIFIGVQADPCTWSFNYETGSRDIDDFIYNTRTIEFAPAGDLGRDYMPDVGMGVNVITVGAVKSSLGDIQSLTYHQKSGADNPTFTDGTTKYVKPEIANVSDFLFPQHHSVAIKGGDDGTWGGLVDGWNVFRPYYGGTDAAASYTAATVAALLQRYPFYKWHPEVVKALLITSSIKAINNASSYDSDNEGKYAMGIPKGEAMFVNNRSRFWNGKNSDFFSSGYPGVIEFTESNINPNKKYRIAIAWLSRGSVVYDYEDIPQDIDLEVWQNGSRIGYSDSWHNSFEFTEVSPTTSADLTIKIKRYNNIGGRVLLGYNLVEVNK